MTKARVLSDSHEKSLKQRKQGLRDIPVEKSRKTANQLYRSNIFVEKIHAEEGTKEDKPKAKLERSNSLISALKYLQKRNKKSKSARNVLKQARHFDENMRVEDVMERYGLTKEEVSRHLQELRNKISTF